MNSEGKGQVLSRWQLLSPQQVIYQAEGEPLQAPNSRPFSWHKNILVSNLTEVPLTSRLNHKSEQGRHESREIRVFLSPNPPGRQYPCSPTALPFSFLPRT